MQINPNNPIIYLPSICMEDRIFKMQEKRNNKCKLLIESMIRKGKLRKGEYEIIINDSCMKLIPIK